MQRKSVGQHFGFILAITIALVGTLPATSAVDLSQQMQQDIKGESTDKDHKDTIQNTNTTKSGSDWRCHIHPNVVNSAARDPQSGLPTGRRMHKALSTTTSAVDSSTSNNGAGGTQGGKVHLDDLHIMKNVDKATPVLKSNGVGGTGGTGDGKGQATDLTVTQKIDTASPDLMNTVPSGKSSSTVHLDVTKTPSPGGPVPMPYPNLDGATTSDDKKSSKPTVSDMNVTKFSDGASPSIMNDKANGGGKGKGDKQEYLKVEMQDVQVSSYQTSQSGGSGSGKGSEGGSNTFTGGVRTNAVGGPQGAPSLGAFDDIPLDESASTTTFGGVQGSHDHHFTVNSNGKTNFTTSGFTGGPVTLPSQQQGTPLFDKSAIQSLQQQLQSAGNPASNNPSTAGSPAGFTGGVRTLTGVDKLNIGKTAMPGLSGGVTSGNAITGGVRTGSVGPTLGGTVSAVGGQPQPTTPVGGVHSGVVIQSLGGSLNTGGAVVGGSHLGGRTNFLPAVQINSLGH